MADAGAASSASPCHWLQDRTHELRAIGAGARCELLGSSAVAVGGVQIALGVQRELMQFPELAGCRAVRAPVVLQMSVPVVLEEPGVRAVGDPHLLSVSRDD